MTLSVDAKTRLGEFSLDVSFTSEQGVTALFGRSGSGKTSVIRMIAGLSQPDQGRIVLDGDVVMDASKGIFMPPHRRRFGYVFQEARLFPHLDVRKNLNYGRWFARKPGGSDHFDQVVDLLGIGALLERRPGKLSGGEQQRVAIGRALLSSPRLLLMDEPLAALDESRKSEVLPYLERLRDELGLPIVYVSHSVSEVARLADRVVLMKDGRIEAIGGASEVLRGSGADTREAASVLFGTVEAVDEVHRLTRVNTGAGTLLVPAEQAQVGKTVRVLVPARDVMIATTKPEGLSALNILSGTVERIDADGEGMIGVRIVCGSETILARITAFSGGMLGLTPGKAVFAAIKTAALERR
ncbi:molybdenum ABC transporter ATP-binding protein [Rhizobiales bacterium RZME27]|uniref:Molybdenum ABC transporter ATP-binding protein n=1 Tax=Endobacterium cereale TaxID=2663029 RepID=A0A6A8ACS6_9HYPH|nr:molybdenum ABC transporter ATP-binding protein [Endobacterium cereale]MEB2847254.1 molybdenum ABC transporter ATP-binding protein [Endobacterium cereale]MQY49103.1 molybdenum ABC transporter ATP-binding protein [Endobacterium cereale]